jgi:hypothetical protein
LPFLALLSQTVQMYGEVWNRPIVVVPININGDPRAAAGSIIDYG